MKAADIKPIGGRLLIRKDAEKTESKGGIFFPTQTAAVPKSELVHGEVLAAGPGRRSKKGALIPHGLQAGDRVMFGFYGHEKLEIEGETLYLIRQEDVFIQTNG